MKKAFEQNVSRAKPRLRLGAFTGVLDEVAASPDEQAAEPAEALLPEVPPAAAPDLTAEMRARLERARAPRVSAAEAVEAALRAPAVAPPAASLDEPRAAAPAAARHVEAFVAAAPPPESVQVQARHEAPPEEKSVQTPPAPLPVTDALVDAEARRERLKERLKAVRENPRPEPLPATVAETGVRAVERIAALQAELTRVKAVNLTLAQDLDATRRQAEKSTEEARLRMDEARRLATEVESRVKLLGELERELAALEGERDEALLSLQEVRHSLDAAGEEKARLQAEVDKGHKALADSLAEEERLAGELEGAKAEAATLRRTLDALQGERDVLAQQVAALTAERAELLEARKALEAVHRALSQAAGR